MSSKIFDFYMVEEYNPRLISSSNMCIHIGYLGTFIDMEMMFCSCDHE